MKASKTTLLALGCFLAAGLQPAKAEPAVYKNGELVIREGILVQGEQDRYYKNIHLKAQPDGTLKVAKAQKRNLAQLEELELDVIYGDNVEVELFAAGHHPVPCVDLEPVAVSRVDDTFHVLIAETPLDPLALCAQVLTPFDVTVQLDVEGLEPGEYWVVVNNEPMEFTIEDLGQ